MTRISWKENRVLSIETRKGVYVVGQMLKQPYIRFTICLLQKVVPIM